MIKIKSKTKTATTDANGFIDTGVDTGYAAIIGVRCDFNNTYPCFVTFTTAAAYGATVKIVSWDGAPVANKQMTITTYYILT